MRFPIHRACAEVSSIRDSDATADEFLKKLKEWKEEVGKASLRIEVIALFDEWAATYESYFNIVLI